MSLAINTQYTISEQEINQALENGIISQKILVAALPRLAHIVLITASQIGRESLIKSPPTGDARAG